MEYEPMFVDLELNYKDLNLAAKARAEVEGIRDAFGFGTPENDGSAVVFEQGKTALVSLSVRDGSINLLLALVDQWEEILRTCVAFLDCENASGRCESVDTFQLRPDLYNPELMKSLPGDSATGSLGSPTALYCSMSSEEDEEGFAVSGYVSEEKSFVGVKFETSFPYMGLDALLREVKSLLATAGRRGTCALSRWTSLTRTEEEGTNGSGYSSGHSIP